MFERGGNDGKKEIPSVCWFSSQVPEIDTAGRGEDKGTELTPGILSTAPAALPCAP